MSKYPSVQSERLETLDAVRGVAALLVLFSHCYAALPDPIKDRLDWYNSISRIFVHGRPAVILFFVLSGLVLSISLSRSHAGTRSFLTRRFFRIYVPFAASILLSAALYVLVQPHPLAEVSTWFNRDVWSEPLSGPLLLSHLLMIGRPQDATLNGPMWSLIIELRLSLIFPFLFALLWTRRRLTATACVLAVGLTEFLARRTGLGDEPYFNLTVIQAFTITLYFMPFFLFGIWIAQHRDRLCAMAGGIGPVARAVLWAAAIYLLSFARDIPNGIGASLLIVLALASPSAKTILSSAPLQWLGRVSYSLYLTHVIVLGALVHLFHGFLPLMWILALTVLASLLVAHVAYLAVERPSMALGRRVSEALFGRRGTVRETSYSAMSS